MEELGMKLKIARVKAGISQEILAQIVGVKYQASVSLWETGRFIPCKRYLKKIKMFLNLDSKTIRLYKKIKEGTPARGKGMIHE